MIHSQQKYFRTSYKKKWHASFRLDVLTYVEEHNIINAYQIYDIYKSKYGKKAYSAVQLTKLHEILQNEEKLARVDQLIPKDLSSNLQNKKLFRGHQNNDTITFYVKSSLPTDVQIRICRNEIDSLINQKNSNFTDSINDRSDSIIESDPSISLKSNSSQLMSLISPGFLSSKYLRCHLLHSFLLDLYLNKSFTIDDILSSMPAALFFKIIGTTTIPTIFKQYPLMRFVCLSQFPEKVLNMINYYDSYKPLQNLLNKLEKEFWLIKKNPNDGSYSIIKSIILSFSVKNCRFVTPITFSHHEDNDIFWRFLLISTRIENNDTHSSCLWHKRWSIKDYCMYAKKDSLMSIIFENSPAPNCCSSRKLTDLVKSYGYELTFILNYIDKDLICQDDLLIEKFCSDFQWENPNIVTNFNNIETKNPSITYHSQQTENKFINQIRSKDQIIIKKLVDTDDNFRLTYIVAKSKITLNGIIHNSDVQWKLIGDLFSQSNWIEMRGKFHFLLNSYQLIRSFHDYALSLIIQNCYNNSTSNDCFELQQTELLSHFNISNLQLTIPHFIGELVESLKMFLLCNNSSYSNSLGFKFLCEYKSNSFYDSLFDLKLLGLLNPKQENKSNSKPKLYLQNNRLLIKDQYFFENIKKLISTHSFSNYQREFLYLILKTNKNLHFQLTYNQKDIYPGFDYFTNIQLFDYPKLPEFDVLITTNKTEIEKDESNKFSLLNEAISQINLIQLQLSQIKKTDFSPFIIFGYCYIFFSRYDGLSLNELCKILNIDYDSLNFDALVASLSFLEEFRFIMKKNCSSALPLYICDAFYEHSQPKHFWTTLDGQINISLLNKQICYVYEQIDLNPGIELSSLYSMISYLSIHDLIHILKLLIYDETVYMTTNIKQTNNSFFESDLVLPINELSPTHILIVLYLKQIDPSCNFPTIRLYPTDKILTLY